MKILVLNGGSSGLKASVRDAAGAPEPLWDAQVDWGREPGFADIRINNGETRRVAIAAPKDALEPVIRMIPDASAIDAVGHRIVHGGRLFRETARITRDVKAAIGRLAEFAPEHNRLELEAIEAAERVLGPDVPQFAVFDTAFHATLPRAATVYPGPYTWVGEGIRRYGFHGISHAYVSRRAAEILGRDPASLRMITCHLGNGASLCAVRGGVSVDTTMGFTPLEGLMMGTRSGSIDPGIIIFLVRHRGYSADQLDQILNKESGLKGVSGVSADMREILAAIERRDERARLAFDVYAHRLYREIGGMLASLGGLDALVFTAGIGENCAPLRELVCRQLGFLGLKIDPEKNRGAPVDADVATPDSAVRVLVIRTEEDWEIARECCRLLAAREPACFRNSG